MTIGGGCDGGESSYGKMFGPGQEVSYDSASDWSTSGGDLPFQTERFSSTRVGNIA